MLLPYTEKCALLRIVVDAHLRWRVVITFLHKKKIVKMFFFDELSKQLHITITTEWFYSQNNYDTNLIILFPMFPWHRKILPFFSLVILLIALIIIIIDEPIGRLEMNKNNGSLVWTDKITKRLELFKDLTNLQFLSTGGIGRSITHK